MRFVKRGKKINKKDRYIVLNKLDNKTIVLLIAPKDGIEFSLQWNDSESVAESAEENLPDRPHTWAQVRTAYSSINIFKVYKPKGEKKEYFCHRTGKSIGFIQIYDKASYEPIRKITDLYIEFLKSDEKVLDLRKVIKDFEFIG